jgi:farnesyl-diphosphate farnesyltransferase
MSASVADSVETWSGKDRADENFPVGSALIARRLRPHVHAFYAFARNADDIADSAELAAGDKLHRLGVMADVLVGRRAGGSPSATALRASLRATGLAPRHSLDLLTAFSRDATKLRYATWDELAEYCRYSAMPVGRHVLDLHGERTDTWAPSDALCTALQVLNHMQDCKQDLLALDRCYLPLDLLAAHGATVDDARGPAASPGLRRVLDRLLDRCDALNVAAMELPRRVRDRRLRLETGVIVGLSRRLAARLRRHDPVAHRVRLTKADALASVAAALRFLP